MKYEINIGDEAMDVVTGIKGIVVVRHDYLYGVPRVGIQPQGSFEGKAHETIHVDILQAELVKKAAVNRKETYDTAKNQPFHNREIRMIHDYGKVDF